jgi:hypothetical protein
MYYMPIRFLASFTCPLLHALVLTIWVLSVVTIAPLCSYRTDAMDAMNDKAMPTELHRLLMIIQYYYGVKGSAAENLQAQMALQVLDGLIPKKVRKALVPYTNANWKVDQSLSGSGRRAKPQETPSLKEWWTHRAKGCHFCFTAETLTKGNSKYFEPRAPQVCPGQSNVVYRRPVVAKGTRTHPHPLCHTPTHHTCSPYTPRSTRQGNHL